MKRSNTLHIILEVIAILCFIFIGVTLFTLAIHAEEQDIHNKSFVGSIILSIGVAELVQFLSYNYLGRRRNITYCVVSVATMVLGVVIMAVPMELPTVCIVWGISCIVFQVAKVINASFSIMKQPFLNIFRIIICLVTTGFAIFLIARNIHSLTPFFTYVGVALLVESFLLIVEFVIHRYQQ